MLSWLLPPFMWLLQSYEIQMPVGLCFSNWNFEYSLILVFHWSQWLSLITKTNKHIKKRFNVLIIVDKFSLCDKKMNTNIWEQTNCDKYIVTDWMWEVTVFFKYSVGLLALMLIISGFGIDNIFSLLKYREANLD